MKTKLLFFIFAALISFSGMAEDAETPVDASLCNGDRHTEEVEESSGETRGDEGGSNVKTEEVLDNGQ